MSCLKRFNACEVNVRSAFRWILARLRNQRFFGLDVMNAAIRSLLDQLNNKVTRHLGASRRDLFECLDQPALEPLPVESFTLPNYRSSAAQGWVITSILAVLLLHAASITEAKTVGKDHRAHCRGIL